MVSRELAKTSEEFVMTVGIGDDLVMRVGIDSVEDLRSNMLHVLHACRLPKVRRKIEQVLLFIPTVFPRSDLIAVEFTV